MLFFWSLYGVFEGLKNPKDVGWLKRKQRLPVSDIAGPFVSVANLKHHKHS
jgi:hypothetical protein